MNQFFENVEDLMKEESVFLPCLLGTLESGNKVYVLRDGLLSGVEQFDVTLCYVAARNVEQAVQKLEEVGRFVSQCESVRWGLLDWVRYWVSDVRYRVLGYGLPRAIRLFEWRAGMLREITMEAIAECWISAGSVLEARAIAEREGFHVEGAMVLFGHQNSYKDYERKAV